ncbi:MAG: hypothetical protein WCQ48_07885 [Chloroflexota bacterium]
MLEETTLAFARVEAEAPPLLDLVADLDTVHDRFSANLDEAMLPLTEFANRWDDDLLALAERMQSEVPLPQMDIASERRRIAEIRAQIPHRHSLLVDQFEIERHAIDAALTVFDDQVARLESQLNAARRTAEAIGDSMRTADFGRTVAFLRRRMEQFAVLAERGAATPEDIADALPVASMLVVDNHETLENSPYLPPCWKCWARTALPATSRAPGSAPPSSRTVVARNCAQARCITSAHASIPPRPSGPTRCR